MSNLSTILTGFAPTGPTGPAGAGNTIIATDNTSTTALYPVMVGNTGTSQVANVTVSKFSFNAASGNLTLSGNIASGNLSVSTGTISVGNITNTNSNGVGNIGTASTYFNTVFAKATSAQYADLAEVYNADADYTAGTVLVLGGDAEVTISLSSGDTRVAGVVSTAPAYTMNAGKSGSHLVSIALLGRVPCWVIGPVEKGDILITSDVPGIARRLIMNEVPEPGSIIGKSVEVSLESKIRLVEVLVGKN